MQRVKRNYVNLKAFFPKMPNRSVLTHTKGLPANFLAYSSGHDLNVCDSVQTEMFLQVSDVIWKRFYGNYTCRLSRCQQSIKPYIRSDIPYSATRGNGCVEKSLFLIFITAQPTPVSTRARDPLHSSHRALQDREYGICWNQAQGQPENSSQTG